MALNDTLLNIGAAAMMAAATHASIHTAAPDATGSNPSAAARQVIDWAPVATGDMVLETALAFSGGAASGPATHLGFWSALTGGTFYGFFPLTGDQTFNAAGEYTVTAGTVNGSST